MDKFSATWVSHTSLSDFKKCPRAYYLKNVYKDPNTGHKVQLMSPALALGSAVHEVLESLSQLTVEERFREPLLKRFDKAWEKISGKRGGFANDTQEQAFRKRGEQMLHRVETHRGPLERLAIKIKQDLPYYWLSEDDNIILCGKIDWLEYLQDTDSVHIIDFKTSKSEEDPKSLQLPIYYLLVKNCQHREVSKASYWYLEFNDDLQEKPMPDFSEAHEQIYRLAKQVKLARQLQLFKCPKGDEGCFHCQSMEKILRGEAELVGVNDYNQDIYILPQQTEHEFPESEIL